VLIISRDSAEKGENSPNSLEFRYRDKERITNRKLKYVWNPFKKIERYYFPTQYIEKLERPIIRVFVGSSPVGPTSKEAGQMAHCLACF
jgi:hypothetical protein